jgi:hypothetical protein
MSNKDGIICGKCESPMEKINTLKRPRLTIVFFACWECKISIGYYLIEGETVWRRMP